MKELNSFITDYPKAFVKSFGFECNDGWYDLLSPVVSYIHLYNTNNPDNPIIIQQVKEKFATLRFYTSHSTDILDTLISEAEQLSEKTCERCGKEGKCRSGGWLVTLCDEHNDERNRNNLSREYDLLFKDPDDHKKVFIAYGMSQIRKREGIIEYYEERIEQNETRYVKRVKELEETLHSINGYTMALTNDILKDEE